MTKWIQTVSIVMLFSLLLSADQIHYSEGLKLYAKKEYDKAFPIIYAEALEDNHAAQYRLAVMYENGYGTDVDYKQAMYWYKLSSAQYGYIESDPLVDENASYLQKIKNQIGNDSVSRGNEFALSKMDTETYETKALVESITENGFFGLQPYGVNYFLPVSYGKDKPPRYSSALPANGPIGTRENNINYDKNIEAEFQFSLRKQLSYDLFGFNEFINFAYTQKVWWQIYADSAPFRETNYLPELYVTVPTSQKLDESIGLEAVKVGFLHESNGQEGYRSRSWNRLYVTGLWQWKNLFLATRAWYRIPESEKSSGYYAGSLPLNPNENGDDNPDIEKYLGYGDIKVDYLYKRNQFSLLLRDNLRLNSDNKGAVEFSWSYPFFDSPNTFWYAKVFHGYGESLIDYDREVTKTAFGFSFSRGLF